MTTKEKIINELNEKNIKYYLNDNEIHVFPVIPDDFFDFLKSIQDDSFQLFGAVDPSEEGLPMHLYIRFSQNK